MPDRNEEDRVAGIAGYMSTKMLLIDHMEKFEKAKLARYHAFLDTWIGRLAVATHSECGYPQKLLLPRTSDRCLFTGKDCPP